MNPLPTPPPDPLDAPPELGGIITVTVDEALARHLEVVEGNPFPALRQALQAGADAGRRGRQVTVGAR